MLYGSVATYAKHPALAELAEQERRAIIRALAGQAFNGWRAFVAVFLGLAGLAIGLISASQLQIPLGLPRSLEGPILVVATGIPFFSVINATGRSFVRARLRAYGGGGPIRRADVGVIVSAFSPPPAPAKPWEGHPRWTALSDVRRQALLRNARGTLPWWMRVIERAALVSFALVLLATALTTVTGPQTGLQSMIVAYATLATLGTAIALFAFIVVAGGLRRAANAAAMERLLTQPHCDRCVRPLPTPLAPECPYCREPSADWLAQQSEGTDTPAPR